MTGILGEVGLKLGEERKGKGGWEWGFSKDCKCKYRFQR